MRTFIRRITRVDWRRYKGCKGISLTTIEKDLTQRCAIRLQRGFITQDVKRINAGLFTACSYCSQKESIEANFHCPLLRTKWTTCEQSLGSLLISSQAHLCPTKLCTACELINNLRLGEGEENYFPPFLMGKCFCKKRGCKKTKPKYRLKQSTNCCSEWVGSIEIEIFT